jgi:hypothetical protein
MVRVCKNLFSSVGFFLADSVATIALTRYTTDITSLSRKWLHGNISGNIDVLGAHWLPTTRKYDVSILSLYVNDVVHD